MNWNDYTDFSKRKGFRILKHKHKNGVTKYAFRGDNEDFKDDWGVAEHLVDIKILIDELIHTNFGNGVVSGYRMTKQPPPEEIYRNVVIGKYLWRDQAIRLPKFMAIVQPKNSFTIQDWKDSYRTLVEEYTVARVRKAIDAAIAELPRKFHKFFLKQEEK